jgi:hypothetical protein
MFRYFIRNKSLGYFPEKSFRSFKKKLVWLNSKNLCFFDKEQTVKRDQSWVCGCVGSLEKKSSV